MRRVLALIVILLASGGPALADGSLRAVVRVDAAGTELWSRIRGQTVDIDAELIEAPGPVEPSMSQQLAAARRLASEHQARVVVWMWPAGDQEVIVHVAEPAADTLFVRRVSAGERGPTSSSATAEAAALVVRSALRALAAGGTIGIATAAALAQEQGPDRGDDQGENRGEMPAQAPGEPIRWQLGLHGQSVMNGSGALAHLGLAARLGLGRARWYAGAALSVHPPLWMKDELTTISVARHSAGLVTGYVVRSGNTVLMADIGAGAVMYQRATVAFSPEVMPAGPSSRIAGYVSPGARVLLSLGRRGLMLELGAAVDLVIGAPVFGYETGGRFVPRNAFWPMQPRVGVGLIVQSL